MPLANICRIAGNTPNLFQPPKESRHYTAAIGETVFIIFLELARHTILPLCGGILFFQGWRLGPILQLGQFLLAIEILLKSASSMITDYQK